MLESTYTDYMGSMLVHIALSSVGLIMIFIAWAMWKAERSDYPLLRNLLFLFGVALTIYSFFFL